MEEFNELNEKYIHNLCGPWLALLLSCGGNGVKQLFAVLTDESTGTLLSPFKVNR